MSHILMFTARDAKDDAINRGIEVTTDQHGLTVEITGIDRYIIIDLSGGQVNVYFSESGESDLIGSIE